MSDEPRSFLLSKWYLDCVGDDGEVFIAYAAVVSYGALAIHYTSVLRQRLGEPTCVESSLRASSEPTFDDGVLRWSSRALDVQGVWTSLEGEAAATIYRGDEGHIDWRCTQPRARAEVVVGDRVIRGLGYTEKVTMTVTPWRMPIDELRWGRFVAIDGPSLIWIDWRGPYAKRLVFLGGDAIAGARVDDDSIAAEGVHLTIDEPRVLRQGALGKTALAIVPHIDRLFPVRILATDERKWCARGTLRVGDRLTHGSVIHEVVRWP